VPSGEALAGDSSAMAGVSWSQLVEQVHDSGQLHVAEMMRSRIRVVDLASERLIYQQADDYADDPGPMVRDALAKVTGKRWQVGKGRGEATPTLLEQAEAEAKAAREATMNDPLVKAALAAFPDAELIETPAGDPDISGNGAPAGRRAY